MFFSPPKHWIRSMCLTTSTYRECQSLFLYSILTYALFDNCLLCSLTKLQFFLIWLFPSQIQSTSYYCEPIWILQSHKEHLIKYGEMTINRRLANVTLRQPVHFSVATCISLLKEMQYVSAAIHFVLLVTILHNPSHPTHFIFAPLFLCHFL